MEISFLALLGHVYNLTASEFHFLKQRKTKEIFEFIALKKERVRSELLAEIRLWHRRHQQWSHVTVLYPGHESYPEVFLGLPQPPVYLTARGDLGYLKGFHISVVGSRQTQYRFNEWLESHFSGFVQARDMVVVSGGAIGIDQKASRLALSAGRPTIQLLPSGLDAIYPRDLASWGNNPQVLFLSEYTPDQEMRRHHFVIRNRLVAALGHFLFVVQAARKSGSMITARHAIEFGREIATLPDFPGLGESSGNRSLIREGAQIIESRDDLITLFDRLSSRLSPPSPNGQYQKNGIGHPEADNG